ERWCLPPPGFDAGNSPNEIAARELAGRAANATSTAAQVRHAATSHLAICQRFHPPDVCARFRDDIAACAVVDACDFAMVGRRLRRGELSRERCGAPATESA
ncbi:MAG: hypothetical protein ACRDLN_11595, partial [Solirubrobacteraceae bacterium]